MGEDLRYVCNVTDLREGIGKRVIIVDDADNEQLLREGIYDIALFLAGGTVFAINNICPHQHAAILHDGFVEGISDADSARVVCPAHGWQFNLRTGKSPGSGGVKTYPVTVSEGKVFIKLPSQRF